MDGLKVLEVICLFFIAAGDIALMFPKRWGLHLFNAGNLCAAIIYYYSGFHYLLAMVIFLSITNTISIFVWRKKKIG